jgi:CRISPR-associated endoribonuclease Cas6
LIKRRPEGAKHHKFYYYDDSEANELLTETLQHKLTRAGLPTDVSVSFDTSYPKPRIKMATYRGIQNKGSVCPVIVTGNPRAVAFAWEVGVGNSTGIGFGALK